MKEVTSFEALGVRPQIQKALSLLGYHKPTPVQQIVLSHRELEKDLCVKAKTGSGKTAAFGIPLCDQIVWERNEPQALVIVPTRELAVQVAEEIRLIGTFQRIKVATVFGKMPMAEQELSLKQKTHVVVGTPGRVFDLIQRGSLKTSGLRYVVIDEADELFYIGLREQVEAILSCISQPHTTMLFSATLGEEVIAVASQFMNEVQMLGFEEAEEEANPIAQFALLVTESSKRQALEAILLEKQPESCIMFVNTQEMIDRLAQEMKQRGYPCYKLHGGMKQKERLRIMEQFKRKQIRYLIASDVAARGIDVKEVSLVINYDMAKGAENYTHRIGRTGRNGAQGEAITFYTESEQHRLREIERYINQSMECMELDLTLDRSDRKHAFLQQKQEPNVPVEAKGSRLSREITRIHINAGKKSKIRTCEIVASICGIEGVSADDIGVIEIKETATFVEMLNGTGKLVLQELPKRTIKGRNRKVNRAR